ncbi:MAG: tRNA 5-methoxyuridine(34)/uridine 5-oxyacetic acid(34) synthase CmoB [bacterium]
MMNNYLVTYKDIIELDRIEHIRGQRKGWLSRESCKKYQYAVDTLPNFQARYLDFSDSVITIGHADEFPTQHRTDLMNALKTFIPWRKGPFNLFGNTVDAEWRSDLKWGRLLPYLEPLEGKRVADIGCNNGYYLFRIAHHKPHLAIGFDPTVRYFYTFQLLQRYAHVESLHFELLGIEHIALFRGFFHTVFCLGILYHHHDPIKILKDIKIAMVKGGQLIIESQGIEGEESIALFPEKRYGKVPGIYFIPTPSCLVNWIKRAGFKDVDCFFIHKMSHEEQRKTPWMNFESFDDFIDPSDPSKTVEGYPAPLRIYVKAKNLY